MDAAQRLDIEIERLRAARLPGSIQWLVGLFGFALLLGPAVAVLWPR